MISVRICTQNNYSGFVKSLDALFAAVQKAKSLVNSDIIESICVYDNSSAPAHADLILSRVEKEKSLNWTQIYFKRSVVPVSSLRAWSLCQNLEVHDETAKSEWIMFLEAGLCVEESFFLKWLVNLDAGAPESKSSGAQPILICPRIKTNHISNNNSNSEHVVSFFRRVLRKKHNSFQSVDNSFLLFRREFLSRLDLDILSYDPRQNLASVRRRAINRKWVEYYRKDLELRLEP